MHKNSSRDEKLKDRWDDLVVFLTDKFSDSETLDIEGVLYLVGMQELGQVHREMRKDDNVNLIHIGICSVFRALWILSF